MKDSVVFAIGLRPNIRWYCFALCASKATIRFRKLQKYLSVSFWGCNNLSEVELEEGVEIIRTIAFYNLSEIRLNSINPPSIANNSINDDIKKIYVPETSLEKYKSAPIWQNFSDRIVPIETY